MVVQNMEIKGTVKMNLPIQVHFEESGTNMGTDAKVGFLRTWYLCFMLQSRGT
jgi:hypothetical protein